MSPARPRKLVLAVIDGMKPSALERAMRTGRAPVLAAMAERGTYVPDCAALAAAAARTILGRVRRRLDREAAAALPIYAEGAGLVLAGASVLFPPLALVGLVGLALLLVRSRRREGEKYAGLRILR